MEKATYTVREAAKYLGVGINRMYDLAQQDNFPAIRLSASARRIVIPIVSLNAWLEKQATKEDTTT